MNVYVVKV